MEQVRVFRGRYGDTVPLFGPLPAVRDGDVLAYEFELPARFIPWPTTSRLQRTYVLLELGVSMSVPCWHHTSGPEGDIAAEMDPDGAAPSSWYVDLVHVERVNSAWYFRDLELDVMVPVDGRHQRMLDLHELADAVETGVVPVDVALEGLRRWQSFLDRHLHAARGPVADWSDFPPAAFERLSRLPEPLGPVVTFTG